MNNANPYARQNKPKSKVGVTLPTESAIQQSIIEWCGLQKYKDRTLAYYVVHVPNGGKMTARAGNKLKKEGVQKGYPDLMLDIARNGYHGLRIELKRDKGGVTSSAQLERLKMLNSEGYYAVVCHGFDSAIAVIKKYMEI